MPAVSPSSRHSARLSSHSASPWSVSACKTARRAAVIRSFPRLGNVAPAKTVAALHLTAKPTPCSSLPLPVQEPIASLPSGYHVPAPTSPTTRPAVALQARVQLPPPSAGNSEHEPVG